MESKIPRRAESRAGWGGIISVRATLLSVFLLGPLVAFLISRLRVLSLGYFNAPGRMPLHANFTSFSVKFQDRVRSCEDVLLIKEHHVAVLACDPGREIWNTVMGHLEYETPPDPNAGLYVYHYAETSGAADADADADADVLAPIELVGFHDELRTIGFDLHEPSSTLFITNHLRGGPRVEQFLLDLNALTATHLRSLSHPLVNAPNSIVALGPHAFFVTNQHRFCAAEGRLPWLLETYLALPLATVVHARVLPDTGALDAAVIGRQAYPNGAALLDNASTLAVASTSTRAVHLYEISWPADNPVAHPTLRRRESIRDLPFLPDNVAADGDGDGASTLLIAGHPHLPSLNAFSASRLACNRAGDDAGSLCADATAGSWASEWTREGGLQHIYSGWEYPSSATVVRDRGRGVGIVAGLYAKGIMVWRD